MTQAPAVSVVIVSRHRPEALRRCLIGVSQLSYRPFEVVIVADPPSCAMLRGVPQAAHVKLLSFDRPNISMARNAGIGMSAGNVVAFIDDDAVPEPSWLTHLVAPFLDPEVMAAGGFVRGRNGISWQSRAQTVDATGQDHAIDISSDRSVVLTPTPDRAIKTVGTNMAFRRSALAELGGFDPRYRFFLDETDLNLRLAARGWSTAVVPLAQVHHGFEESARRRADRVPRDLTEIGASWAVFLAGHCPPERVDQTWAGIQTSERARLLRYMVTGALEPRDVRRLMQGLLRGYDEGLARPRNPLARLPAPPVDLQPYPSRSVAGTKVFSGRVWSCRRLNHAARQTVRTGRRAMVICLSWTAFYHRVRFTADGVWEQTGGLFGRSERHQKPLRLWTFRRRVAAETARVEKLRELAP